jgi:hypothetical protein
LEVALNRRPITLIATSLAAALILMATRTAASRDAIFDVNGQNLHISGF